MSTKTLTRLALYLTLGLALSLLDSMLPNLTVVPGIKLGLANVITLWMLPSEKKSHILMVLLARIILVSLFAGQATSFFFSLAGGILCIGIMSLLYHSLGKQFMILISIFGAVFHNLGQVLVAFYLMRLSAVLLYIPFLFISALITGAFTGLITHFLFLYIHKRSNR